MNIQGKLYDGASSKALAANLTWSKDGVIQLEIDGEQHILSADQVHISSRLGGSARYIELSDFGRFETNDNTNVDTFSEHIKPKKSNNLLYKLESNIPLIVVALIITIGFVWGGIRWGIPAAADYIVDAIPEKATNALESSLLSRLEQDWFKPSKLSEQRQQELQALFEQVITTLSEKEGLTRTNKTYEFKLRDAEHSIGANALAFPTGSIVMTDQLVNLVENDTQLAGVLAHEIGHLDGQHSLRQIVRGSLLTFLVAWITGDISGASGTLATAPAILTQLKYSRDFESEADHYAIKYLDCHAEKLEQMARFFEILGGHSSSDPVEDAQQATNNKKPALETEEESDFLASHPATTKRISYFRNHYQNNCQ